MAQRNAVRKELQSRQLYRRIMPHIMSTKFGLWYINGFIKRKKFQIDTSVMRFAEKNILRKDNTELRICIFQPLNPKGNAPGVLYMHGGGYAIGTPELSDCMIHRLIEKSGCTVIAPDYRMSLEAPYPAALDDCYTALLWMRDHAAELGIREDQLMIAGDSSGGGLTAALSFFARDKGEVAVAFQMPLYPMIDDRTKGGRDMLVWNGIVNQKAWRLYLGDLYGSAEVPYYAAPARATDYSRLPPTATFVGELEPFRDETIQYVENLRKAGVRVDFAVFEGCYHAFEQAYPEAEVSKRALSLVLNAFSDAVLNQFAAQPARSTVAEKYI